MERQSKISLAFSGALLGLFIIYGCTGDANPPGDLTAGDVASNTVGLTECFGCHADGANPTGTIVFGDSDAALGNGDGWLGGPHGNANESPRYSYFGDASCAKCHDQLGDGELLADFSSDFGVDSLGAVDRPVVGCESCHGSGAEHFGAGPMELASPGPEICGQCHNEEFDHNKYNPEGDNIYEDYRASVHNSSINEHNFVNSTVPELGVIAACSKCHTDEGGRMYKDVSGGGIYGLFAAPPLLGATDVQCRTCHDAHNPDKLLLGETTDSLGNTVSSAEYDTCANCHQSGGGFHGEDSGHSWGDDTVNPDHEVGIGNFDSSEIIYDTHYDNPDTPHIEGYVLDMASDRACRDCHNPHSADIAINEQWAGSAHAGHILEVKEDAFANTTDSYAEALAILNGAHSYGSVTEADGPAWTHYDFKANTGGWDGTGQQACQRCHTSTGFRNFAGDPLGYDADGDGLPDALNEFTATGGQREMLYCWACHTDNAGGLRKSFNTGDGAAPLLFVNTAPYSEPAGRIGAVGDLGGSNICVACHSGGASGAEIAASSATFSNTSFTDSHYLAAAGTLFRTVGYEYPVLDYSDYSYFLHGSIGTAEMESTGENGPCVGCHMRSGEGHAFEPVALNAAGQITDITTYGDTCSVCHGGKTALVGDLNSLRAGFDAALDVLEAALVSNGMVFAPSYPYFYNAAGFDPAYDEDTASPHCQKNLPVKNWQTGGAFAFTWNIIKEKCDSSVLVEGIAGTGPANMGAAFNFYMLEHEPGAYVHNGLYARRLIFDSLDWLDNGIMNGTIAIVNAAAQGYLGLTRP